MSTAHRPGPLKQIPKAHKPGKHRTKGQIDRDSRHKTKLKGPAALRKSLRSISKEDRRQQSISDRLSKLRSAIETKRASAGGSKAPILATVLVLGGSVTAPDVLESLATCDESIVRTPGHGVQYWAIPRFKTRLGFLTPNTSVIDDVLDSIKVSDVLVLVWPKEGEEALSAWTELTLSTILAHGVPSVVNVVPGLGSTSGKQREATKKILEKMIDKWSLGHERLLHSDSVSDGIVVIRTIAEMKKKKMVMQRRRGHMLAENIVKANEQDGECTLLVSGYLRGPFVNVNRLVHLPGWGDFQLEAIEAREADPHPLKLRHGMFESRVLAQADDATRETLQSEVVPDPMDAEQTWPDEHDHQGVDKLTEEAEKRRVPKGTSSYQAAWILDDEEAEGEDGDASGDDDEDMEDGESGEEDEDEEEGLDGLEAQEEEEEMEEMGGDTATEAPDGEEDMDDEDIDAAAVEQFRQERENVRFPDEVDTPLDIPARVRFQKYRGLKSFRTSPWDPLENLPFDYARIFKFANFNRTRKLMLASTVDEDGAGAVPSGTWATLHIKGVPTAFCDEWNSSSPLVIYTLLPHEQKMSIVNVVLKKHPTCTVPIAGKSKLIFHVGFRRFEAEPIFSQHTNGDKFKMERFLMADGPTVASMFAPITFAPASVLVYRVDGKGRQELVATGAVLNANPDRVVLKRIVLSGHPFKINRRSVVARYMFFNTEDIEWFKPVELHTPTGRRGHIKESVGTHGHMKARFDQQLNACDSVMMSLYKRAFPKWTYNARVPRAEPSRIAEQ